jgi:uncharacterized protein YfaP (DUF2135 family)
MRKSIMYSVILLSLFSFLTTGCYDDGGNLTDPPDENTFPSDFVGTWYLLSTKSVGDASVIGIESATSTITIFNSEELFTFQYAIGSEFKTGTATWESRSEVNYLILNSNDAQDQEIIIHSYNNNICKAKAVDKNEAWTLVRGRGIYGVINDNSDQNPLENETVILLLNGSGLTTSTTDSHGIYYFNELTAESQYEVHVDVEGYYLSLSNLITNTSTPQFSHFSLDEGSSNSGTISGSIIDNSTEMPPSVGVIVIIEAAQAISTSGNYFFFNVENGSMSITASAQGYYDYTGTVTVSGGTAIHNIDLTPYNSNAGDPSMISMFWSTNADFDLKMLTPDIEGTVYVVGNDDQGRLNVAPYAYYHGDELSGYDSPEKIEFGSIEEGVYTVYAHAYSEDYFSSCNVFTTIEDEYSATLQTISASNSSGSGVFWIIAEINGSHITVINELTSTDPDGNTGPELGDVTLTWSAGDPDLDLHILTPEIEEVEYHVYHNNPGNLYSAPYMQYQDEHSEGPGPEEIWVYDYKDGTYKIYVHNYSQSSFSNTNAIIKIKDSEDNIVETVSVSGASGTGTYWYVADVNGTSNTITVINRIQATSPAPNAPQIGPIAKMK